MSAEFQWTEYGAISIKLQCSKLADLCLEKIGVQTGPFGSQLHKKDYVETGTPIITVEHLGDNRVTHQNTPFVSDKDKSRLSKYSLKEGDIVFSRVGSVDRRALVRKKEDGWLFSGRCLRVRADVTKIDPKYLSYFFGLEGFKKYIRSIAVGATMPSINTKILSEVPIYYPESLDEQRQIADVLCSLDEKIAFNTQTNQTLEQIAQALFKSWFVDFDPVKAKIAVLEADGTAIDAELAAMSMIAAKSSEQLAELKQSKPDAYEQLAQTAALFPSAMQKSELGEIPEGWSTPTLKSLSDKISKGTTPRKPDLVNASDPAIIPFIKVKDISDDSEINRATLEGIPASIHEKALKRSILTSDDLLFSIAGTIGRVSIVDEDLNNSNTNQAVAFVRLVDKESFLELVYLTLKSSRVQGEIASKVVQGVQANASLANIGDIKTVLPDNDLLDAWKKIIHPIIKERRTLSKLIRELNALRDTLLPKLLSGEITPTRKEATP